MLKQEWMTLDTISWWLCVRYTSTGHVLIMDTVVIVTTHKHSNVIIIFIIFIKRILNLSKEVELINFLSQNHTRT